MPRLIVCFLLQKCYKDRIFVCFVHRCNLTSRSASIWCSVDVWWTNKWRQFRGHHGYERESFRGPTSTPQLCKCFVDVVVPTTFSPVLERNLGEYIFFAAVYLWCYFKFRFIDSSSWILPAWPTLWLCISQGGWSPQRCLNFLKFTGYHTLHHLHNSDDLPRSRLPLLLDISWLVLE